MVDRPLHRRIHLSRLSQEVGPPLNAGSAADDPKQKSRASSPDGPRPPIPAGRRVTLSVHHEFFNLLRACWVRYDCFVVVGCHPSYPVLGIDRTPLLGCGTLDGENTMTKSFARIFFILAYLAIGTTFLAIGTTFAKAVVDVTERSRQEACFGACKEANSVCLTTPSANRLKNMLWCRRQLKTCRALCRGGEAKRGWGWWGR